MRGEQLRQVVLGQFAGKLELDRVVGTGTAGQGLVCLLYTSDAADE